MLRITFDQGDECGDVFHSVTIESAGDRTIEEAMNLVVEALLGAGFQPETVQGGLVYALCEYYGFEPEVVNETGD